MYTQTQKTRPVSALHKFVPHSHLFTAPDSHEAGGGMSQ